MNSSEKTYVIAGLIILVALGYFLSTLSIVGDNAPHHVSAFGQNWTLTSSDPWGAQSDLCYAETAYDYSTDKLVSVYTNINPTSSVCNHQAKVTVSLDSVDLRSFQKVVIHRNVVITASSKQGVGWSAGIFNDALFDQQYPVQNQFQSINRQYGDVIITNDGTTLTVRSDEYPSGKIIPVGSIPLYWNGDASYDTGNSNGGSRGTISYSITGLDLTPFAVQSNTPPGTYTPAPTPVVSPPVVTQGPQGSVTQSPSVVSWWDVVINWFRALWRSTFG